MFGAADPAAQAIRLRALAGRRAFCPLRAVLGWFSRRGRFAIYTDSQRCIECGTCNRYCEMGIDIRMRARHFLLRYLAEPKKSQLKQGGYTIEFMEYDWRLNDASTR